MQQTKTGQCRFTPMMVDPSVKGLPAIKTTGEFYNILRKNSRDLQNIYVKFTLQSLSIPPPAQFYKSVQLFSVYN